MKIKPIDSTDYYTLLETQSKDTPDLMLYAWGFDWPNSSTIFPPLFASDLVGKDTVGENKSRVQDKALDAIMNKALAESNATKQTALWVQADQYVSNTIAAVVPLWQLKTLLWKGSNVGSVYNSISNSFDWATVYLKNPTK